VTRTRLRATVGGGCREFGGDVGMLKASRRRASLVAVVTVLLITSFGSGALAYDLGYFGYDGVNIRTGPYLSSTVIGLGYTGQDTCLYYVVVGDYANGNPYWWYHHRSSPSTSPGYSHVAYLGTHYPYVGCT
jgi:hypothetical protein